MVLSSFGILCVLKKQIPYLPLHIMQFYMSCEIFKKKIIKLIIYVDLIQDMVMVQCADGKDDVRVSVTYSLLNPGNEQLSVGEIPLPKLYVSKFDTLRVCMYIL